MDMRIYGIMADLIMIAVIVYIIVMSVKQGFAKSFFKCTKMLIVILITSLLGSLLVGICREAFVTDMVDGRVSNVLVEYVERHEDDISFEALSEKVHPLIKRIVPMQRLEKYYNSISGNTAEVAQKIGEKIENLLIDIVSKIVAYIIMFVVVYVIVSIIVVIIEKFCDLPMFTKLNHVLGFVWGVSHAYVVVSFGACIAMLILGSDCIEGTFVTRLIYRFGLFTH